MQANILAKRLRRVLGGGARGFERIMERGYYGFNLARSRWRVTRSVSIPSRPYARYITDQLEETLRKKRLRNELHFDVIPLIDMLAKYCDISGKSVLCVGCRNRDELVYFRKHGAGEVIGIDLFSDHPDIAGHGHARLAFPGRQIRRGLQPALLRARLRQAQGRVWSSSASCGMAASW